MLDLLRHSGTRDAMPTLTKKRNSPSPPWNGDSDRLETAGFPLRLTGALGQQDTTLCAPTEMNGYMESTGEKRLRSSRTEDRNVTSSITSTPLHHLMAIYSV